MLNSLRSTLESISLALIHYYYTNLLLLITINKLILFTARFFQPFSFSFAYLYHIYFFVHFIYDCTARTSSIILYNSYLSHNITAVNHNWIFNKIKTYSPVTSIDICHKIDSLIFRHSKLLGWCNRFRQFLSYGWKFT